MNFLNLSIKLILALLIITSCGKKNNEDTQTKVEQKIETTKQNEQTPVLNEKSQKEAKSDNIKEENKQTHKTSKKDIKIRKKVVENINEDINKFLLEFDGANEAMKNGDPKQVQALYENAGEISRQLNEIKKNIKSYTPDQQRRIQGLVSKFHNKMFSK